MDTSHDIRPGRKLQRNPTWWLRWNKYGIYVRLEIDRAGASSLRHMARKLGVHQTELTRRLLVFFACCDEAGLDDVMRRMTAGETKPRTIRRGKRKKNPIVQIVPPGTGQGEEAESMPALRQVLSVERTVEPDVQGLRTFGEPAAGRLEH